jgi:hypothetical protein
MLKIAMHRKQNLVRRHEPAPGGGDGIVGDGGADKALEDRVLPRI